MANCPAIRSHLFPNPMQPSRTVSISIARQPADVYAYLAEPADFPRWSEFITAMQPDGDEWIATTTASTCRIRFTPRNTLGVVDHIVTAAPDVEVFVPLRVVANGDGSEVLFTIFRQPTQDDPQFEADVAMVVTDLRNLKRVLESR